MLLTACLVFPLLSAGRICGADKEAEHVTKQQANMKECVSDTIQLLSGRRIPNEMGCVTCDWCDVLIRGSWEELLPFSSKFFLSGGLSSFPPSPHRDP